MTEANKNTVDKTLIEAGKWIARENAGDMTKLEQIELDNLLANDAGFQLAYLDICKQADLLDIIATQEGKDMLSIMAPELLNLVEECENDGAGHRGGHRANHRQRPAFRLMGWAGAVAASLLILIISSVLFFQNGSSSTIYETAVGGHETVMLKDGSVITLNTDTRISVALIDRERRILLEYGEAYFDVAKDKARPFIVMVGDDTVRAVGTAFNIKRRTDVTNVTVTEGIVEVQRSRDKRSDLTIRPVSLTVGEDLTIDQKGTRTNMLLAPQELERTVSWRGGMVHFNGKRLDSVVREIQYYVDKEIILSSELVSDIIVGGSFNTNNVASFLKGLELNFPIKVIERKNVIIISYKQKSDKIQSASG